MTPGSGRHSSVMRVLLDHESATACQQVYNQRRVARVAADFALEPITGLRFCTPKSAELTTGSFKHACDEDDAIDVALGLDDVHALDFDHASRPREVGDGYQRARRRFARSEEFAPNLDEAITVASIVDEDGHRHHVRE